MKSRYTVVILIAVLAILGIGASLAVGNDKVDICHIPPGNPDNAHMINVSVNAIPAHLAHGDPPPGQQCGGGPVQ